MSSKITKKPIKIPPNVAVEIVDRVITAKNKNMVLSHPIPEGVDFIKEGNELRIKIMDDVENVMALAGTIKALTLSMLQGLERGFEKKLTLVGVGYRAQLQGRKLMLTVGFSHPVEYQIPEGISAEVPSQTDIVIKGADKQLVGQVAAELRAIRPPEPYKGKGIKYVDEIIIRKEGKKK